MKMETSHKKSCDAAKATLRGKFIMINAYIKKKISNKPPNFIPQGTL